MRGYFADPRLFASTLTHIRLTCKPTNPIILSSLLMKRPLEVLELVDVQNWFWCTDRTFVFEVSDVLRSSLETLSLETSFTDYEPRISGEYFAFLRSLMGRGENLQTTTASGAPLPRAQLAEIRFPLVTSELCLARMLEVFATCLSTLVLVDTCIDHIDEVVVTAGGRCGHGYVASEDRSRDGRGGWASRQWFSRSSCEEWWKSSE
jgi:hypothetical protein